MSVLSPHQQQPTSCPHCGTELEPFELPDEFGHEFDLACFNDECQYYIRGWAWMEEHYAVKASYRFRVDPNSGFASPIGVWSAAALRDRILTRELVAPDGKEAP